MNYTDTALNLTMRAEHELRAPHKSYLCDDGRMAVGYGHVLVPPEHVQLPLSRDSAVKLLHKDLKLCSGWLNVRVDGLTQFQFDALVCWAYHALSGRVTARQQTVENCMLIDYIKAKCLQLASAEFDNWVFVNNRFNHRAGARRLREQQLFMVGEVVC